MSRPGKLSHTETLLYEIDMLRFAAGKLQQPQPDTPESWFSLECFLLHFRNLIEFFGKKPQEARKKNDNLSILKPEKFWSENQMPSDDKLKPLRRMDLWEKYEGNGKPDKISRYLQHCTEQRVEGKSWDVDEMLSDLDPVIKDFEKLLPDKQRRWVSPPPLAIFQQATFSTVSSAPSVMIVSSPPKK